MFHMAADTDSLLLTEDERPAARVFNPGGRAGVVLVCEHASRFIPAALGGLGLNEAGRRSHAAWDIGALDTARAMAEAMDAPLVHSCVSRLVYDCNRPPEAPDAMPARSERIVVPGNEGLTEAQRAQRVREVFVPFSALVEQTLDARADPPVLVTVHSFTPVYMGRPRAAQIGILHDTDSRLADAMLESAGRHTELRVARNDPYGPEDGVTYTLRRHGLPRGLLNVMIEVRNDLLRTPDDCAGMARLLAGWLEEAIAAAKEGGERKG
ncbi:N-formylglutamate amidohydrolase [Jhaorihella thermophila]|uniref:Predicted N-formylglutamate amidohydrolase n=2 Tax=Jhaorihella thermophila TaxID=488547 RepID=A0A1H5SA02_9RHOB|nr:Predicted N-formylglutamate amidohydrolase [Jhaorihella thermophila]